MPILEERAGWRGVFVDLPGTGRSQGQHDGVRTQRDILHILDGRLTEAGFDRQLLAVAGTSNGAALALALGLRRSDAVQGVALRVPMMQPDRESREVSGSLTETEVLDVVPAAYRREHDEKVARLWVPAREERIDADFLSRIREDPDRYGLDEVLGPARAFSAPALVVLGRQDARVGWEHDAALTRALPRGTVAILDRAGHALPVGRSQTTVWQALAHDWLDRVEEYASGQ